MVLDPTSGRTRRASGGEAPLPLVVLAAGLSSRYGSLKQLEPVGPSGEALMDYGIFDAWRGAGATEVVLVVRREIEGRVRDHVSALVGGRLGVGTVVLDPADLPGQASARSPREKPWGTGHGVWACRRTLAPGPFLLMNADDFYGVGAFRILGGWADRGRPWTEMALVPYRLADSLSEHGGVNRAVLRVSGRVWLQEIVEVFDVRRRPHPLPGDPALEGRDRNGGQVPLRADRLYSANLWGFTPAVFPLMEEGLARFLEERGDDPRAEFLIADGLRPGLERGDVRIRVLDPGEETLGVTHREDRAGVAAALSRRVERGAYPEDLREGFRAG